MKKLFKCELIHQGFQQELFYREGETAQEVKEGLELFQWPAGEWIITPDANESLEND